MLKIRCRGYEGALLCLRELFGEYCVNMQTSEDESVALWRVNDNEIEIIKEDGER